MMGDFVPWNSQDLDSWADQHAEGQFIDLEGKRTHYVERGEGDPLLLIHGFNMDWYTWLSNIDALAEHFKVYALDLWGLGLSTREPLDYGYPLFAEQVRLFMEAMELEKVSLAGHSMGGGTVIYFTRHHRHLVEKIVLVGATGMPHKQPFRARLFQTRGLSEFAFGLKSDFIRRKNYLDFWFHKEELLTDEYFAKAIGFQKIQASTEVLLTILRRDFFHTLKDEIYALAEMEVPTLIVWGREDAAVPLKRGQEMHAALKGSRLESFDNAGHLANFEIPELFNRLVIDFLKNPAD
jgi:pimeloyl-ACP methyl ester carboxylesterase